jgi:hypothetical protein
MSDVPEPIPPPAHLRASDTDRNRVIGILREALTDGRLDAQEHAERLDAVFAAKTLGELAAITRDLVPDSLPTPASPGQRHPVVDPVGAVDRPENMIGVLSGGERKGRWRVRRRTNAVAVCGGFELDMTEAVFDARTVEIRLFTFFGGLNITVPDGMEVRNESVGILGGVSINTSGAAPAPDAPVLVLRGFTILGGVSVQRRKRD